MPNDLFTLHTMIVTAIAVPGAILLAMSRGRATSSSETSTQRMASRLGWTALALAASYVLVMALLTAGSSGPGGLGSQGNPLAAIMMLGYAFVVAPIAWLVLFGVGIAWWTSRRRGQP
jgi:hypothetical protein